MRLLTTCPFCNSAITWEDRGYAQMPVCECPEDEEDEMF